jgi:hypothetical protein
MYLIFDVDAGWKLVPAPSEGDYPVGRCGPLAFPHELFISLDNYIHRLDDGCHIWVGGAHRRAMPNAAPYFLNKFLPQPYKYQISARQLILARYLNLDVIELPRFRIGITCTRNLCVAVEHMIPFNFYPRTKTGAIASGIPDIFAPTKTLTEEEKEIVRRTVLGSMEDTQASSIPKIYDHETILGIIGNRGRTADQLTPEELAEIERKRTEPKEVEGETTLDELGFGTKKPA